MRDLIILSTSVIDKQPGERRGGRSWVTELRFARRPNMIEVANGTLLFASECREAVQNVAASISTPVESSRPAAGHLTMTMLA